MPSAKCIGGPDAIFKMCGAANVINVTCFGLFAKIDVLKHYGSKTSASYDLLNVNAICSYIYLEHCSVRILVHYVVSHNSF
jgi:hypothetical protein